MNKSLFKYLFLLITLSGFVHASDGNKNTLSGYYDPDRGATLISSDGNYKIIGSLRAQMRINYPGDDPATFSESDDIVDFDMTRVRLHLDGHAYSPKLTYSINYDLKNGDLLSGSIDFKPYEYMQFRIGRWNPAYGRERNASTRGMQVADRSIVNSYFMIDRQQGALLYGQAYRIKLADVNYYFGVFNGTGRTESNDDNHLMYTGRFQFNILGKRMRWQQGDLLFRTKPHLMWAIGGMTNISKCTAFATSGCNALPGFELGKDSQYKLDQWFTEVVYKYRGISFQSEFHQKDVTDRPTNQVTRLEGYYLQAGFFPSVFVDIFPDNFEIATRYARVDANKAIEDNFNRERNLAFNLFFNGHRNRLSFDVANFDINEYDQLYDETRYRVQWEFNF